MVDEQQPLILVVEDDPGVAVLQRRRLERAQFRVEVAADLDAGMAALARGGVALVVMDYRLGPTTGFDLHRSMKAAGYDVPVIMVSGSASDAMVVEAMRVGIRDVVLKSTDYLDYLPDAVRAVLNQAAVAPERTARDQKATVLVVEDDAGVALLERRQLERAGYCVEVAANADEAMAVVRSGDITAMTLDLRLPDDVSGIALYQRMKSGGWNIPAVLVTAYPDQAIAIEALRAGIRDFLPKSADYLQELPRAIDRVVAQVRVERKLVESELRLASIIGTTVDSIVMCDEQLRIVLFNGAAEEMFGCPAHKALQLRLDAFVPDLAGGLPVEAGIAPGSMRRRLEVDGVRADGRTVPIEVSISDVVVHQRRLLTVIARDVSERRRIEAELREADRRKDEFLGMLAHELRNPLAAIMNAGEALHRMEQDPRGQKLTGVVRRQTRALARMVDDLLDVSRVTLGKIQLAKEPILLGHVVGRALDTMRDAMARAHLRFEANISPEPVWLTADATRLEQVVVNLLTNAIKFTPEGGAVTVTAGREGNEAMVRVRDTGIGIAPSLLPQVFELFVQGDTSLDRSKSGLGIGLALVRQIVTMHGGRVEAASAGVGHGSEFTVRLPASTIDVPDAIGDAAPTVSGPRRLRVLVVDDQPDIADAVGMLIEALHHDAHAVYDGQAALTAARTWHPDVMIVDIGMPGLTGYDVARQTRQDPTLASVQLIALTGYGRDEDRARVLEAGFDLHLTKPIDDTKLEAVLASLAERVAP